MENKTFAVNILNEAFDVGERIVQGGTSAGTSLLRKASLVIKDDKVQLRCSGDLGDVHELGTIPEENIKNIKYIKNVLTPIQQLIKPAMSGAFLGVVILVILYFKDEENFNTSILANIALVSFISAIYVVVNLGKIVWQTLSRIIIESDNDKLIEVMIENEKLEDILNYFRKSNFEVRNNLGQSADNTNID